jgi:hypothetical protein
VRVTRPILQVSDKGYIGTWRLASPVRKEEQAPIAPLQLFIIRISMPIFGENGASSKSLGPARSLDDTREISKRQAKQ